MRVSLALLLPVALLHCEATATERQLRVRAAYELNCPERSLHVDTLGETTRGVRGCGRRLIYVEDCNGGCKWVRDGR